VVVGVVHLRLLVVAGVVPYNSQRMYYLVLLVEDYSDYAPETRRTDNFAETYTGVLSR
jgi:hypothetical protein